MFSRADPSETIVKSRLAREDRAETIVKTRFVRASRDFAMVSEGSVRENNNFYDVLVTPFGLLDPLIEFVSMLTKLFNPL